MHILVTGGAGFIGSHLVGALLQDERVTRVRVLDNLATGSRTNLQAYLANPRLEFMEGDIRDWDTCQRACAGMDRISHQAALGSVPRSIQDPLTSNAVNITGTLHLLEAARLAGIQRLVYAASSSTYGDHPDLPKMEDRIGRPLSPYAVTKYVNELYAEVYSQLFGLETIGLRYFNIFGPRQNPNGPYAAVIPLFIRHFLENTPPQINGDGTYSRDFTYVDNAVLANLLALFTTNPAALNQVYNIACGAATSLNELVQALQGLSGKDLAPRHGPIRSGDVPHSLAAIGKAQTFLGYEPRVTFAAGLAQTYAWFEQEAPR